ncbi:hypothetical protein NQ317_001394 [Molorchus minor]|uniref:Uncharacterized protein n=1 Tax=Molorchus minor TaxID=1323400 RepID=A0ABQ9J3F8_9CUCU|nr:hypothetical protein NQ317_001394 [Molorchus minor]
MIPQNTCLKVPFDVAEHPNMRREQRAISKNNTEAGPAECLHKKLQMGWYMYLIVRMGSKKTTYLVLQPLFKFLIKRSAITLPRLFPTIYQESTPAIFDIVSRPLVMRGCLTAERFTENNGRRYEKTLRDPKNLPTGPQKNQDKKEKVMALKNITLLNDNRYGVLPIKKSNGYSGDVNTVFNFIGFNKCTMNNCESEEIVEAANIAISNLLPTKSRSFTI